MASPLYATAPDCSVVSASVQWRTVAYQKIPSARIASPAMSDAAPWIVIDTLELEEKFNRRSFEIAHHLSSHPLLQLTKLMELAERTLRTRPGDLHYDAGSIRVDQRWDDIPTAPFSP